MRHFQTGIIGLTGVVLLGALAVGAATKDVGKKVATGQYAVQTAVFNSSQSLTVLPNAADQTPLPDADAPSSEIEGMCVEITAAATELLFSDSFETGDARAWGPDAVPQFSAIRMLDLELTVRFAEGVAGDHLVRLKLLTPKGYHYQTLSVPVTSVLELQGSQRQVEGYPRPLAVRVLSRAGTPSLPEVTISIPVGGTPIVTNSLYGSWTTEAYLDDQSKVCASLQFVLTP